MSSSAQAKAAQSSGFRWKWMLKIVLGILLFLWVFQSQIVPCGAQGHSHDHHGHSHDHHGHSHDHHGHSHDHHGHSHDAHDQGQGAAYKYSKQANENVQKPKEVVKPKVPAATPSPTPKHTEVPKARSMPEKNPNLWYEAIGATLLVSAAPFLILFLIPLDNSKEKRHFLKVLLSFASGGLLGDAFLHLIPHAIMANENSEQHHGHGHGHSHSHGHGQDHSTPHSHDISVGLWVLVGIVTFLIVEKLIRIMKGGHHHSHGSDEKHSDSEHEVEEPTPSTSSGKSGADDKSPKGKKKEIKEDKQKSKNEKPKKAEEGEIQVSGYLNLAADFTHNLTDGLTIGASFVVGRSFGWTTTLTILLHEVPHEIGDFAILVQSGCNKRKAMMLQLVTALGALSGTFISLIAGDIGEATNSWILPFTAGGFIYIATVSVIPELLQQSSLKQSVKEILALFAGILMMVLIGKFEEPLDLF